MAKSTTRVTATPEQVGNAEMSAAPLSAALGEAGRQEIESSTSASAAHTGVSTIFTEVHSATFQNLNGNVKAALAAAGDQASPLLKSVGEFLSNIKPIQADYVQGELATMSVTIPQADPYIMQAFRELFNITGKEAALRVQMMNRALKRAEELSENHSA